MVISYKWLQNYLPAGAGKEMSPEELGNILTAVGLEVEAIEPVEAVKGGLEGLVTGEVLTCERHSNADKLSVTTVNTGDCGILNIVCGAPNVAAGQKVIVAVPGTTVYPTSGDPIHIKKAKIRGVESAGMICAEDEIGLGTSHAGIMILPDDTVVGMPAHTYFNLPEKDYAIHIGLTPNRSDANSHLGVAKDICAWFSHHKGGNFRVNMPSGIDAGKLMANNNTISINIEALHACPRYAGMLIEGVNVSESPDWLKRTLATIGIRSINNIVDVTNYVLHEYGQPLHAFDADKLNGRQIVVRQMPEGTLFTGLDGKERKLLASDLMICNAVAPVAMGGVFGGQDSGITDSTVNIFLESAWFEPDGIRRSSLYHGLRTDAASHFEKGADINNVIPALLRAAKLISDVAGGTFYEVQDVYPHLVKERTVLVRCSFIRKLNGKNYERDVILNILTTLGFGITELNEDELQLTVPTNKADVYQPADIAEEILRIDGLDNVHIPDRLNITLTRPMANDRKRQERLSGLLCGMGLQEIITNSIVNSKYYPGEDSLVKMINSLTSELDCMRPSMLESGLEVVAYNCNRKNTDLALYEFGNIYRIGSDGKYIQQRRLAIWITGNVRQIHWKEGPATSSAYHLKGILNNLRDWDGIRGIANTTDGEEIVWKWKNEDLCRAGKVSKEKAAAFGIKQDVYYASVDWDNWLEAGKQVKTQYSAVSRFPAVQRDLALILDKQVTFQQVEEVTTRLKIAELQTWGLFDVFESDKLGAGKKSWALNFTFQPEDRTLTDEETNALMKRLTEAYISKLNATIRE